LRYCKIQGKKIIGFVQVGNPEKKRKRRIEEAGWGVKIDRRLRGPQQFPQAEKVGSIDPGKPINPGGKVGGYWLARTRDGLDAVAKKIREKKQGRIVFFEETKTQKSRNRSSGGEGAWEETR